MENIHFNLEFIDRGYGIANLTQTISWNGSEIEFIVNNLTEDEKEKANILVTRAWDWISQNIDYIKDYLSDQLGKEFEEMRKKKAKNVPPDDTPMIRKQLEQIHIRRVVFYPKQSSFTLDFPGIFNGYQYKMYVSVNDDFTFKAGSILTMGGFRPPKDEPKQDMTKATILYDYHIRHGNEGELYKHYVALPANEIDAFIDLFIADETEIEDRTDLLLYLALYSYACGDKLPDKLYQYLIENEVFYYGEIYLRADEKFAGELIKTLDEVDDPEAYIGVVNHILCALAMIPCRQTNNFFIKNSKHPLPIWAEKLHILPEEYAKVGGWETQKDGVPRILFHEKLIPFARCKKDEASPLSPVVSLPEKCGFCGQPLTLIFDETHKLSTCLYCSCYQTVFTKTDAQGVHWHPSNKPDDFFQKNPQYMKNEEDIAARFEYGIRPTTEKRRPTYTANEFAMISYTQIGGMPTAINDMEYPVCLDCGRTMRFVAQFDMYDIEDGEGIYYFFVCNVCGSVGANYGQS